MRWQLEKRAQEKKPNLPAKRGESKNIGAVHQFPPPLPPWVARAQRVFSDNTPPVSGTCSKVASAGPKRRRRTCVWDILGQLKKVDVLRQYCFFAMVFFALNVSEAGKDF